MDNSSNRSARPGDDRIAHIKITHFRRAPLVSRYAVVSKRIKIVSIQIAFSAAVLIYPSCQNAPSYRDQLLVSEQLNPIVNVNAITLDPITAYTYFIVVNAEHIVMMALRFVPAVIDAYRVRMTCSYIFAKVRPRY